MPDYDRTARNVAYGLIHRPCQVIRWVGEQLTNQALPIGQFLANSADELDAIAGAQLNPYVPYPPPLPMPGMVGPPPPPAGKNYCSWNYTASPAIPGYVYAWITEVYGGVGPGSCLQPPGAQTGPGWGPGYWQFVGFQTPPPVL